MSTPATDFRALCETLDVLSSRLRGLPTTLLLLGGLVALAPMGSEPAFGSNGSATTVASGANAIPHDREFSFQSRVAYQYRIEEVYWQHRVWPKENPGPKPPLDAVIPGAQIRAKVEDYLKKSNALDALWGRPITDAQLQAEMDRMAAQSRAPEVLRELFDALGNDPFVIAETLARQTLADRLIRSWYARDERFHGELRRQAEAALEGVSSGAQLRSLGAEYAETTWRRNGEDESRREREPEEIAIDAGAWGERLDRLTGLLGPRRAFGRAIATGPAIGAERLAALPVMTVSPLQEEDAAFFVMSVVGKDADAVTVATASWTKTAFDAWWAEQSIDTSADLAPANGEFVLAGVGAVSVCVPDSWSTLPVDAEATSPSTRYHQTAVWTGSEMIVWGGVGQHLDTTGGRYNPTTDRWVAATTTGAPSARGNHTAVWTGSEMIVWGGSGQDIETIGGRYRPSSNSWTQMTTANAPAVGVGHTAVWTGSEMIVWGGWSGSAYVSSGGRYNPTTDRWVATTTIGAPSARGSQTAVWTGNEMIVWGGWGAGYGVGPEDLDSGSRYNPSTDSWVATTLTGAPSPRTNHTAVWTGGEMIVWGGDVYIGQYQWNILNTGGRYDPSTDSWLATPTIDAPAARRDHAAVWTGSEMIVWGGCNGGITGGCCIPSTDSWVETAPGPSSGHTAVWAESEMVVWGGYSEDPTDSGGRYCLLDSQSSKCGDGAVDPGEDCDHGNQNNADGCDVNCRFLAQTACNAPTALGDAQTSTADIACAAIASCVDPQGRAVANACAPGSPLLSVLETSSVSAQSAGLVAAYGFDAVSGTIADDSSGNGNTGSLVGASWNAQGKFGRAVQTGPGARVSVANSTSLGLTTGATLEAWVYPTANTNNWSTVIMKEQSGALAYVLYSDGDTAQSSGRIHSNGSERYATGGSRPAVNTWTHLATTYDGTTLALYVNGTPVASTAYSGLIATSSQPLGIGGNGVWGEYFTGLIDEVRIYDRALTQSEIQTDMVTPVNTSDSIPPTISLTNPTDGAIVTGTINVTANATDEVVVVGVQFKLNGAQLGAEDTAAPYQVTWNTFTTTNGSHVLTAVARDGAGNVTTSNQATITVNNVDATSPTVTITTPIDGAIVFGTATGVAAHAADNTAVLGVQFELDGVNLGAEDTTSAYSVLWDTTTTGDGRHTLVAIARDGSGNRATSAPITVTVSNADPPYALPGLLYIDPRNPRYFTDGTGRSILLVGSHTWANFVDNGLSDPPRAFDYASYLDFLEANNLNFFRLWTWEQAKWNTWTSTPYWFAPSPYQRTGPGTALDGKPKFDLTSFNQAYFDRMRQHVIDAGAKGIYASIMLFQGWGVGDRTEYSGNPWSGHPFNAANNASGVNGDLDGDGRGGEVHTLASAPISALQDAYVRKVIDTVNDLDNVLYEICNECNPESIDWQNHMIALIKSYEAGKPKRHPVGFTGDYWYSNATLFSSNADWISPGGGPNGSAYLDTPPPASGAKVIISDTDHLWGMGGDRTWVWKSITRGINTMIMDGFGSEDYITVAHPGWTTNDPNWVSMRANMGYARSYAQRMNLTAMPPRGDLTSTTYALASPTAATPEFLVYAPSGGTFTVNLTGTAGSFSVEWLRPATGAKTSGANVAGGATRSFTPPFSGDAVLYLHGEPSGTPDTEAPTVSITAPANGATVFGTTPVSAAASDNVGIVGVQVTLDGANLGSEDTVAPYSVSWNTTLVADGSHTLGAVARDAAGISTTATVVTVTVDNADTQAPTITMIAPADDATVFGITAVSATATDNVGVVGVQFTLDGAHLGSEDVSAPYAISWNTTLAADGSHTVSATARDTAGNTATTASLNVTVDNTDSQAPTVSIATPTVGQVVSGASVTLSASASDNVGVVGVQFMVDGVNVSTEDTQAPYSVSWNSTSVSDGGHGVSARARDAAGSTAASALVNVTVDNVAPEGSVVINSGAPATNSRWVTLTLAASDVAGTVTHMRFSTTGTAYSAQEAYATTKAWRLSTGSGTKSVYAQFKSATGNWSSAVSDTIVLDTSKPTISSIVASRIVATAAFITWMTNEAATSLVEYGVTTSDGSQTPIDSTLVTSHGLTVSGLAANTTYYYRVYSADAAGNQTVSSRRSFETASVTDTTPPSVLLTPAEIQADLATAVDR